MQISTTRFGDIPIEVEDILLFPDGLAGMEDNRHWVILADSENDRVGWLQSVSRPELALPVVSPRRFVPDYRVRVGKNQLEPISLTAADQAYVLTIISREGNELTLNLKAPLIINLDRRLGRQVLTKDDQPVQYKLSLPTTPLRKIA